MLRVMEPIRVHTIRDYLTHGYTITAWCSRCTGHATVDLERLIAKGLGDKRGLELRLGCRRCRRRVSVTISPLVGSAWK
jgi:hypothetical protein